MKILWSILAVIGTFIPLWLYLGAHALMSPQGFWQELALGIVGLAFLGSMQVIFLFFGIGALLAIWSD